MMKNIFKALSVVLLAVYWASFAHADTITYFHNDLSGSPMVATDVSGNLLWKQEYSPYGARSTVDATATATNNLWFAGKPQEPSYGISYMGARYYHPLLGRFLSIDPMEANPEDIHGLNRYSYANNNPAKYVDSDGHNPLDIGFFGYDIAKLVYAIYRGEGVKGAALDVAMSAVGVVSPVPFAGQAMKAARIAERGAEAGHVAALATKVESAATKVAKSGGESAKAARGREAHKNYENALGEGYDFNKALPSGKRPDAVDLENRIVRELKPDNARAIRRGERQVEGYKNELEQLTGEKWTSKVDTYRQ